MNHNTWQIYNTPPEAWDAMLSACSDAKKNIDIEQYIFVDDNIGKKFLEVCKRKVKEGVRVRLLCDTAGSFSFYRSSLLHDLKKDGIELVFFNTFIPVIFKSHYTWWLFRDHRKLMVIDGETGFTGSVSIWEYAANWRDTFIKMHGVVVKEMQDSFNMMWERAQGRHVPDHYTRKHNSEDGFSFIPNIPRLQRRELYYRIVDAIRNAKKSITIAVPYFVPDRRMNRIIILAKRRGVEVTLLLTEKSDYQIVDIGARTYFHDLLKAGIRIHLYTNRIFHSKIIIIDDNWATVGSMNLDNVSLRYNFEANIISTNPRFISEIKESMSEDLKYTEEVTFQEWIERPLFHKFLEFMVRFIRPFI